MKKQKWIMVSALLAGQFFILTQSRIFFETPILPLIICLTVAFLTGFGLKEGISQVAMVSILPLVTLFLMRELIFVAVFAFTVLYTMFHIWLIQRDTPAGRVHFYGGLVIFVLLAGLTYFFDIPNEWANLSWVDSVLENVRSVNETLDVSKQIDMRALEKSLRSVSEGILLVFPSILILMSGIFAGFSYYWGISFAERFLAEKPSVKESFSEFELPSDIFRGILLLIILVFGMRWMKWEYHTVLFYNVVYLSTSAFLWLGIAVIDFFLKHKGIRTSMRVALILLMFILPISVTLFPAIGCAEKLLHIRQRLKSSV